MLLRAPYVLGLVQVLRVLPARQRRRRLRPELRGAVEQERPERREPRRLRGLTRLELPLPGQDRPDLAVARGRGVQPVARAEGDDVVRGRVPEGFAAGDVAGQRPDVGAVLAVDRRRRRCVEVVVEDRPRRRRDRRLRRRVGRRREREVVVRLVAALELRDRVVHRRLDVRHVDHAVRLHLRRRRRAHGIDRVVVPGQRRRPAAPASPVGSRRAHRRRRGHRDGDDACESEQRSQLSASGLHLSS